MKDINNPIATNDQAEHELLANEIFNDEEILDWKEHIRSYWLDLVKPSEVMLSCFDKSVMRRVAASNFVSRCFTCFLSLDAKSLAAQA